VAVKLMLADSVTVRLPILNAVPDPLIVRVVPTASGGAGRWLADGFGGGIVVGGAPNTGTTIASVRTSVIAVPKSAILRMFLHEAIGYRGV